MKVILTIFLMVAVCTVRGQKVNDTYSDCLESISSVCKNWKKDSLGLNGFREVNFVNVLRCVPSGDAKQFIDCIGTPNETITVGNRVSLVYYLSQKKETVDKIKAAFISFLMEEENKIYGVERGNILR